MVFAYSSYRTFLKASLAERIAKNPSYSLRSMAKQFGISATLLSQITNGKRALTPTNALRFGARLGLKNREMDYFQTLVQYENEKNPEAKQRLLEKLNSFSPQRSIQNLSLDAFRVISDWYHLPILQMLRLTRFNATPANISRRLGISALDADLALERLTRLGMVERLENGTYRRVENKDLRVESSQKNVALCSFHKQMLARAIDSLERHPVESRYFASETISIDPEQLPEARQRINQFLDEMVELFSQGKELSETYHLGTQLFRLTRPTEDA